MKPSKIKKYLLKRCIPANQIKSLITKVALGKVSLSASEREAFEKLVVCKNYQKHYLIIKEFLLDSKLQGSSPNRKKLKNKRADAHLEKKTDVNQPKG